jgi:cellulose synthase (UDP-forming)
LTVFFRAYNEPRAWVIRFNAWLDRVLPPDPDVRQQLRIRIFRVIGGACLLLGLNYILFRATSSLNYAALWFAIPLLIAEAYSLFDTVLFVVMMWQPRRRVTPKARPDLTVDVFITTYSEEIELVAETARAAMKIRYPHRTWVLDDGKRAEMKQVCDAIGCGYITRGPEWDNRPRHAKAGNVNNALMQTDGAFILILDADQIPEPEILDRTLGYFDDPQVAFVQTPQYFYNVTDGDPFGSQAPLFYGPIQEGKDGWNSAFFCGSNAVLRREALFQLGLVTYIDEMQTAFSDVLNELPLQVGRVKQRYRRAARHVTVNAEVALRQMRENAPLIHVLDTFNAGVREAQNMIIAEDLAAIVADLEAIAALDATQDDAAHAALIASVQEELTQSLPAIATTLAETAAPRRETLGIPDRLDHMMEMATNEALDVQPLATFTITEDMATAMRLHSLGWKSVFHNEILARGLAPEDLASTFGQRLRWGAGTIQVFLHENPLKLKGLSLPQRLQYFTTVYSYFSGFTSVIYLVAPIIYLLTGISPVQSFAGEFLWRIIPYLILNKIMFRYVAWGLDVFRGEQYSLALFPLWIRAVITVFSGEKLTFKVTPKSRQSGVFLNLVIPQLAITVLLVLSSLYGLLGLALGWRQDTTGVIINVIWAAYDIWMLSVVLKAAVYSPAQAAS